MESDPLHTGGFTLFMSSEPVTVRYYVYGDITKLIKCGCHRGILNLPVIHCVCTSSSVAMLPL